MTSENATATPRPATVAEAGTALDELMALVGVDGLVAAYRYPDLLARVDQHAAAVRDAVTASAGRIDPLSLARYARSIAAAADRAGEPMPAHDWSTPGWHALRLVAVCWLADEAGLL